MTGPIVLEVEAETPVVLSVTETPVQILSVIGAGPPGPPGPSGEGDLHFTFNQDTPALVWTIVHNLGKFPWPAIYDSAGSGPYEGEVRHIDDNSLTVTLSQAFSGVAYLN